MKKVAEFEFDEEMNSLAFSADSNMVWECVHLFLFS